MSMDRLERFEQEQLSNVGRGDRRGHLGRHGVEQSSNSKAPRAPGNRQVVRKMNSSVERTVVSLDEVFKKDESQGDRYSVGFRRKSVEFVDEEAAEAYKGLVKMKTGGRPSRVSKKRMLIRQARAGERLYTEMVYGKRATEEEAKHVAAQMNRHRNEHHDAFSKATIDDLTTDVDLYTVNDEGEMVPLSQDQKKVLSRSLSVGSDDDNDMSMPEVDVPPIQDQIVDDSQPVQQQQNVIQGVDAEKISQLSQFINRAVQDINTIQLRSNDPVEIVQYLHRMWDDVRLIGTSYFEFGNIDISAVRQINGALLKVLADLNALFPGNQQVQQWQALLTEQGPTTQNMQSVLDLLSAAQNHVVSEVFKQIGGSVQQLQGGLQQLEQGFDDLIRRGVTQQGLQQLVDMMQNINGRGQAIEQELNRLSQLQNVSQEQINALRSQLGAIAQRLQVLNQLRQCLQNTQQLQGGLQQLEQGFDNLIRRGVTQQGLQQLVDMMQNINGRGQAIEQELNRLSQLQNVSQEQINALRGQLGVIAERLQELNQLGGYLQRIQELRNELRGAPDRLENLQKRFSDVLGAGDAKNELKELALNGMLDRLWQEFNGMCEHFARIYQEENTIRQELGGANRLNGVSNDQYIGLINQLQAAAQQRVFVQNQLIGIALDAVEWQIAPYFKEGLLAGFRDWWSGASGVQGEIERLRQKSQSQYDVTQEDLQNLLQKLNDFLQRNLPNSEGKSRLIALIFTILGAFGAAGSGAAAASASSECAVFSSVAYGIASQGGALCAAGPVGFGIICLGSLAAAIGGAVYLYRKN